MRDEGLIGTGLRSSRKDGEGRDESCFSCVFSSDDGHPSPSLRRPRTDWLVGKYLGTGVAALLGKKCAPLFAIGVGGGESDSRNESTSELSGDWTDVAHILIRVQRWSREDARDRNLGQVSISSIVLWSDGHLEYGVCNLQPSSSAHCHCSCSFVVHQIQFKQKRRSLLTTVIGMILRDECYLNLP